MDAINEKIIEKILTTEQRNGGKITIVKWYVNNEEFKAGNIFTSEVSRIAIEYKRNEEEIKIKHVFVKIPFNSMIYERGMRFQFYGKEAFMHSEVLPQMSAINAGKTFWPRCYHVGTKDCLFLEDLTPSGYRVENKDYILDFGHSYLALKRLAQFHGLSFKLLSDGKIPDIVREEYCYIDENAEDLDGIINVGFEKFYDKLDSNVKTKYSKELQTFRDLIKPRKIFEDVSHRSTTFNVLNHGDFWGSNVVFKYDPHGVPEKAKILDFQQCRYTSPAVDLIYFFISSIQFEVLEQYFDLLLSTYLETLNKVLSNLGCDLYTMENLKSDITRKYKYAVFLLIAFFPFLSRDSDRTIDKAVEKIDAKENDQNETSDLEHYMERATKFFKYFVEKDVFGFKLNGKTSSNAISNVDDKML